MAGAIFWNFFNAEFRLGADAIQPEVRLADGRIKTQAETIKFNSHMFRCEDGPRGLKQAQVIRDSEEFKTKRVREVSEEELTKLMGDLAKQGGLPPGVIKPVADDEIGYKMPEDKHTITTNV